VNAVFRAGSAGTRLPPDDVRTTSRVHTRDLQGEVRIPKAAEVVANRIRKRIVLQDLSPDDRLPPEVDLQQQFGVSRPVIREAIRILESEGLIRVARGPGGGVRVNAASMEMLTKATGFALQSRQATVGEVFQARAMIEPPAARLAALNRPKEASAALRAQIAVEWLSRSDQIAESKAVADFHRILLEECGNVALGVVGAALQQVVLKHMEIVMKHLEPAAAGDTSRSRQQQSARKIEAGIRSHEKLVELIAAGKGDEAEQHWVAHMAGTADYWIKSLGRTSVVDILE